MIRFIFLFFVSCASTNFKNVELVDVYDGDTFKVNIDSLNPLLGNKISIRVRGINTPEIRNKNACKKERAIIARELAASYLRDSEIDLIDCKRGKFFRLVCSVKLGEHDLSDLMLQSGFAVKYGDHDEACEI